MLEAADTEGVAMRMGIWSAAVLVMAAAAMAWGDGETGGTAVTRLPFTVGKETTGIVEPLREGGVPDYVKAMNEKYGKGVKGEENAYVGWMQVLGTKVVQEKVRGRLLELGGGKESEGMGLKSWSSFMQEKRLNQDWGDLYGARRKLWSAEDYPLLAEYLGSQEKALDAVKEAFSRPKYWMPTAPDDSGDLNSNQVAGVNELSDTIYPLAARATLKFKSGDYDGFMGDVKALAQLAKGMEKGGRLNERGMGYTVEGNVCYMIGAAASSGKLTSGQCVQLWQWWDGLGEMTGPGETYDVHQRWSMLERACLLATGKAESWSAALGEVERDQVNWDDALKRMNAIIDVRVEHITKASMKDLSDIQMKNYEERQAAKGKEDYAKKGDETREEYTERLAVELSGPLYYNNWGGAEWGYRVEAMKGRMVRLMVAAAAAYRAEKGVWPEKGEDLVPGYLKELPRDICSEGEKEAVKYVKVGEGVRVYSVGENGRDDGGESGNGEADDISLGG